MIGNDRVRFCEHCQLHVTNVSCMTRQEATRLVARSEGRLCVRFVRRPNGKVITKQMPQKLHQIGRQVSRFAAGAFTASLTLSSAAAQSRTGIPQESTDVVRTLGQEQTKRDAVGTTVSGTIKDPNDAVIPGAIVTLIDTDTNAERQATSSNEGEYSFENVARGSYKIRITSPGFQTSEITDIQLEANTTRRFDATLQVGAVTMGVMVMLEPEEPLVKAVLKEDGEAVAQLAFASADVNVRDKNTKTTALEEAVETGNLEIVRILLRAGANVNTRNEVGLTPLMFIRDNATPQLIRELISAGGYINARDESGGTSLMAAAAESKYEVVKELIDAGASVGSKNANGGTALIFAAGNGDSRIAKLLIDLGEDVNARDNDGNTPLMFAAEEGEAETVKFLLSFNAEVNAVDNNGQSALLRVAASSDIESATALLNAGADLSLRDKDGRTALAVARAAKQEAMIKLLESRGALE